MNGAPVPVVSRLLGHSNERMTLRYACLADRDIKEAAERIGVAMAQVVRRLLRYRGLVDGPSASP